MDGIGDFTSETAGNVIRIRAHEEGDRAMGTITTIVPGPWLAHLLEYHRERFDALAEEKGVDEGVLEEWIEAMLREAMFMIAPTLKMEGCPAAWMDRAHTELSLARRKLNLMLEVMRDDEQCDCETCDEWRGSGEDE